MSPAVDENSPLNFMASHGQRMLARGYDIVPIKQGGKFPPMKVWNTLRCGLRHAAEREERGDMAAETQVEQWAERGVITGIGVVCETVFAIDIDVSDMHMADDIACYVEELLGVGVRRIGRAPRVLLVFRCDAPIRQGKSHEYRDPENPTHKANGKEAFHAIDFLGSGRQFVAYGNHPDTERPYFYDTDVDLADIDLEDLPRIEPHHVKAISAKFDELTADAGWERVSKADAANLTVIEGGAGLDPIDTAVPKFGASLDDLERMLAKLDPDIGEGRYGTVVDAVGFEFGDTSDADTAFEILEAWACGGAKWSDKGSGLPQLKTRWRSALAGPSPGVRPARLATLQKWINDREWTVENIDELEAAEVSEAVAGKRNNGLSITMLSEFLADRTPHDWLLRDYLTANELAMLFGPPGSYKSFIALDVTLHIATGRDWHGHPVKQAPVLYIAGEGRQGLRARAEAWCAHHGVDPADVPFAITSGAILLNDKDALQAAVPVIRALVEQHGPLGLFVIDTLARNNTADENDNTAMGMVIANTTILMDMFKAAALLIHHSGTGNTNRARGASAILGALDSQYRLDREGDGLVKLVCTKMKDAAEPHDKWFAGAVIELPPVDDKPVDSLVFEETEARSGEEAGDITDPARGLKGVQLEMYELIRSEGPVSRDTLWVILDADDNDMWHEIPRRRREQARSAMRRLEAKGLIVAPVDGLVATTEHVGMVEGFDD